MTQDQQPSVPWAEAAWMEQAVAWIHAALEQQGMRATGPIVQPHEFPWSTVLRVPTAAGICFSRRPRRTCGMRRR